MRIVRISLALLGAGLVTLMTLGVWFANHPNPQDPYGVQYVLWKHGLHSMNPQLAAAAMVVDSHSTEFIVGKSEKELRERFILLPLQQNPRSFQAWYKTSRWRGHRALFMANTPWMIVFKGDKACELVMLKG